METVIKMNNIIIIIIIIIISTIKCFHQQQNYKQNHQRVSPLNCIFQNTKVSSSIFIFNLKYEETKQFLIDSWITVIDHYVWVYWLCILKNMNLTFIYVHMHFLFSFSFFFLFVRFLYVQFAPKVEKASFIWLEFDCVCINGQLLFFFFSDFAKCTCTQSKNNFCYKYIIQFTWIDTLSLRLENCDNL